MSLGDHLEELRSRMILALLGLAVGTIVCLCFGKQIVALIKMPYEKAVADITTVDPNDQNSTSVTVTAPTAHLTTLAPADAFIGFMKISFIAGLIISCPWVLYHLWMFVAAGLYVKERRYVQMAVPFSATLFIAGAVFFVLVVAPLCLKFFLKFGELLGLASYWTFQKYVGFITSMMLVFGIAFQTPIAIFLLTKTGLVSIPALKSSRKFVLLGCFVVSAVATPPDVVSQITLALPLYVLFELGILISYFSKRKEPVDTED